MNRESSSATAWTKGDAVSRALLSLASDRGLPEATPVTAGLIELAQRHGLIGLLARHTQDEMTRAVQVRESLRCRTLVEHLSRLLPKLHDAGIRAVVLKGPGVAEQYEQPEVRRFSDLDILIPEAQLDDAMSVLASDVHAKEVPAKRPRADKRDVLFEDSSGIKFNVDLHWSLFSYSQLRGAADGATTEAWERAILRMDSPWGPVWELPAEHRVAFLAAHAVLDHRFRLILFRDLLELERRGIGWQELDSLSRRYGLRSVVYVAFWIAQQALGVQVPKEFLSSVRPRSLPVAYLEWALPRIDIVRFDGHRPLPINLATVLLNDSPSSRTSLLVRAPLALPAWRRRVARDAQRRYRPRILIVVTNDRRRGAEVFAERLRDGLTGKGWVIEAVGLYRTDAYSRADVETLSRRARSSGSRFDVDVLSALIAKIRSFEPDIVVANGGPTLRYGVAAHPFHHFRLVYIGIGEPEYWIRSRFSRWINRFLLRRTDYVIAVSETTRRQLIRLEPSLAKKAHTGYTGVPDDLFNVRREAREGPLRLLAIGSLTPEKDPLMALRAVAATDEAQIRFVGAGPLDGPIRELAARLGIEDRVMLVGSVSDVAEHLAWSDLLILTSKTEGLPGAILEAGAAGVPCVSMNVGGVGEAIVDGVSGLVVNEERELISALRKAEGDRQMIAEMGAEARKHIAEHFTIEGAIATYSRLLLGFWR